MTNAEKNKIAIAAIIRAERAGNVKEVSRLILLTAKFNGHE